jgi:8-oxo-dGTP pyrophosphatase MutT (NUDIX family)
LTESSGGERVRAPEWLIEHAQRFADSGVAPATPRLAATVILMRPVDSAFEVYAQQRAATMRFAPNMYAFPGGSVDPRDASESVDWAGPEPGWWGERLSLPPDQAQAVVCAAVREVFEECGVLLAGPDPSTVVGDVSTWEQARVALLNRDIALVELLAREQLVVRSDLLAPWARWLTPEFEPRRFDTFFFLARLPAGQNTRDVGGEASQSVWQSPDEVAFLAMLPPPLHTLRQLARFDSIDDAFAASQSRDVSAPVRPRLEVDPDGIWFTL